MYCFKLVNLDPARLEKVKWILDQGIINKDVWLAGGSLRTIVDHNETIVDYDLFFHREIVYHNGEPLGQKTKLNVEKNRTKLEKLGFKITFECPEGKLYSYEREYCTTCNTTAGEGCKLFGNTIEQKVQLVCEHFYSTPEELLSTFDLTPCLFATDGKYLWTYKSAIKGVNKKQVRLHTLTYPIATMRRIVKYAKKGYSTNLVCKDFIGNLMEKGNIQLSEDQLRVYID